jgi:uncharacterized protein (DUF1778 family)
MDLTKLTVNLVPNAMAALDRAAQITGDTRTDTVNRALQAYVAIIEASNADKPTELRWDATTAGVRDVRILVTPLGGDD